MKRLLLVGWDAADWKVIDPLLAAGEMPHLAKVISGGVRGNHATLYPALSPMLWTSIATGKRPGKHGIHGFTEPAEDGLSVRPVSNLGRRTKAFWNILNQHGKRSVVVGWWPSHPVEPISGAMVSNHYPLLSSQRPAAPMQPAAVWPPEEAEALAELRVHPTEISSDMLRLFAPDWARVNQKEDSSVHDLAGLIAETMTIHAAATDLMARIEWDLAAVYYVGIDHFSHRFMRFHAGKARGQKASDPEFDPELFRGIVANAYRYHDVMLGRLLALAGEDCGVIRQRSWLPFRRIAARLHPRRSRRPRRGASALRDLLPARAGRETGRSRLRSVRPGRCADRSAFLRHPGRRGHGRQGTDQRIRRPASARSGTELG